jgi:hypothetical protein
MGFNQVAESVDETARAEGADGKNPITGFSPVPESVDERDVVMRTEDVSLKSPITG